MFGRFYSVPSFGPDDAEIFYMSRTRGCFYFSSSFSSTTDGVHAFVIKPDGITFFDRGLLLGIVLFAILVRMSVKCSMGSSKSLR